MISQPHKDLFKKTPRSVINSKNVDSSYDVSGLHISLVEKQSQLPALGKAGVSCIIANPDPHDNPAAVTGEKETEKSDKEEKSDKKKGEFFE